MISYGGPELLLLFVVFIVTPIVYRKYLKTLDRKKRILCISSLWAITFLIGYTDVIYISLKARKLCREEAGLHVYKTVEADGFLGASNIDYWAEHGFQYLEMEFIDGKKTRYTLVDGKVAKENVDKILSNYEYVTDLEILKAPFNSSRKMIRDRKTREVLGEIISFAVYPGWLDSRLLGILGLTWSPAGCDGDYLPEPQKSTLSYKELVKAVIKPKELIKGDEL